MRVTPIEIVRVPPYDLEIEQVLRIEPKIDASENKKTSHHQARADEQDNRQRNFSHHQNCTKFSLSKSYPSSFSRTGEVWLYILSQDM